MHRSACKFLTQWWRPQQSNLYFRQHQPWWAALARTKLIQSNIRRFKSCVPWHCINNITVVWQLLRLWLCAQMQWRMKTITSHHLTPTAPSAITCHVITHTHTQASNCHNLTHYHSLQSLMHIILCSTCKGSWAGRVWCGIPQLQQSPIHWE